MKTHTKINQDGSITLTATQKSVLIKHVGKDALLEIDESQNRELRAFFEVIVQYFFYQHPKAGWADFRDCRECIKVEFNPVYITDKEGNSITVGGSTGGSKKKLQVIIDKLQYYFMENGLEFPDSISYCQWRDSGIGVDEVYPPLLKLKEKYLADKEANVPVWHQNK